LGLANAAAHFHMVFATPGNLFELCKYCWQSGKIFWWTSMFIIAYYTWLL